MTVMVALLRAVNVGGTGSLAMADLRRIATGLGYQDVATYIQSGNLVLATDDPPATVAADLAQALAGVTSTAPDVVVRTLPELRDVVAHSPYLRRGDDPAHLHVLFAAGPAAPLLSGLEVGSFAPEEATAKGSEVFLHLPGGVGRSRLASALGRQTAVPATMRGWRTVTRLLALAEQAEG